MVTVTATRQWLPLLLHPSICTLHPSICTLQSCRLHRSLLILTANWPQSLCSLLTAEDWLVCWLRHHLSTGDCNSRPFQASPPTITLHFHPPISLPPTHTLPFPPTHTPIHFHKSPCLSIRPFYFFYEYTRSPPPLLQYTWSPPPLWQYTGSPHRCDSTPGLLHRCYSTPGLLHRCDSTPGLPHRCDSTPGLPTAVTVHRVSPQLWQYTGSPHRCDSTPGLLHRSDSTPGLPHRCDSTPGLPHRCDSIPGLPHRCDSTPGLLHRCYSTPGLLHRCDSTPGLPHRCDSIPGLPHRCDSTPGLLHRCDSTPGLPHRCESTPGLPTAVTVHLVPPPLWQYTGSPHRCDSTPGPPTAVTVHLVPPPLWQYTGSPPPPPPFTYWPVHLRRWLGNRSLTVLLASRAARLWRNYSTGRWPACVTRWRGHGGVSGSRTLPVRVSGASAVFVNGTEVTWRHAVRSSASFSATPRALCAVTTVDGYTW